LFAGSSGDFLPPSPPAEKATYLDFIRSRHTLQNALALSSYGPTSNAQYDQRYKSDADEQHYKRDRVVFEPMSITAKHWSQPTPLNVLPQPPVASLTAQLRQLLFFGQL